MSITYPAPNFRTRLIAGTLSLAVAIMYFVIAFGWVADDFESPPRQVMFAAGLAYLIGGVLITQVGERLLRLGLLLNSLVLIIFVVSAIAGRSTVDGLTITGKIVQIGLEIALFWLVVVQTRTPAR